MRVWVGLWVLLILLIIVLCQGSFLVRYLTRFTEEIFACLISLIFIYEAIKNLLKVSFLILRNQFSLRVARVHM